SNTTRPGLPAPFGASLGHVSPFFHVDFAWSNDGPSQAEIESSDADHPPYDKNLPSVAWLPVSARANGWMWMKPSPWVWMPARTPEFPAGASKVAGLLSHSPQMFTPNAACQWSPMIGGVLSSLRPITMAAIATVPITMMPATVA